MAAHNQHCREIGKIPGGIVGLDSFDKYWFNNTASWRNKSSYRKRHRRLAKGSINMALKEQLRKQLNEESIF